MTVLNTLLLEDNRSDAELLLHALRSAGFEPECQRVESEGEYLAALDRGNETAGEPFDVVLADYRLPQFDGLTALDLLQARGLDIPFILISGTIGEELAVDAMKRGAADYLLKDRLARLGQAVTHALQGKQLRMERARAKEQRRASERRFRALIERSAEGFAMLAPDGSILYSSPTILTVLGYDETEPLISNILPLIHPDDVPLVLNTFEQLVMRADEIITLVLRERHKDGSWRWIEATAKNLLDDPDIRAIVVNFREITERKAAEDALRASEERYRELAEQEHAQRTFAEALRDAAAALNSSLDYDAVLDEILNGAARIARHDVANIFLMENGSAHLVRRRTAQNEPKIDALRLDWQETGNLREMVESGLPLVIADTRLYPGWQPVKDIPLESSYVGTPIRRHGETIGVLNLGSYVENAFTNMHAEHLQAFANQAAVALENARLLSETRQRAQEFQALYEAANELAALSDVRLLLQATIEHAAGLFGAANGCVYLYDPVRRDLEVVAVIGQDLPLGTRQALEQGMAGRVASTQLPICVDDYGAWEGGLARYKEFHYAAMMQVPMLDRGELVGVLGVAETAPSGRKFTEADVRLLTLFANQAAAAVHNARLLEETALRARQLSFLYDAGLAVNRVLDSRVQTEFLFQIAMKALNAERAEYWRHDAESGELILEFATGYSEAVAPRIKGLRFFPDAEMGILGWVAQNQLSLRIGDLPADPRYISYDPALRSAMWSPVQHEEELLGVLGVFSTRVDAFSPADERLLMLFANQAAIALENARLFRETHQQLQQIQSLRAIDRAISSSSDLQFTFNLLVDELFRVLNVDAAGIRVMSRLAPQLEFAAGKGFRTTALPKTRLRLGEGYAGTAVLEQRIIAVPDLRAATEMQEQLAPLLQEDFVSYCAAPLIAKGQVVGVLEIFKRERMKQSADVMGLVEAISQQAALAIDNARLFEQVWQANTELRLAYDETIEGWSRTLDLRDKETEGHTLRVTAMTEQLARAFGIGEADLMNIRRGSLLHDIGKMGVPDAILFKPGPLTEQEWAIMRLHPGYAYELLKPIRYLQAALAIPYAHHEKWDGSGYPRGLKGEAIPRAARIFAVVDVWDALSSNRPYRRAWEPAQVREYLCEQSGKHFDPEVVEVFEQMI